MNDKQNTPKTIIVEIDGPRITAEKFTYGIRTFFKLIEDVALNITGKQKAIDWIVSVKPGSITLCATPESSEISPEVVNETIAAIGYGIESISQKEIRPPHFSDNALEDLFNLGNLAGLGDQGIDKIRIKINGKQNELSPHTVAYVDKILGVSSEAYGTIDGKLLAINLHGTWKFSIYDEVTNKEIKCRFDEEMYDEVIAGIRKRVSVYGLIKYRRNGEPANVEIESFRIFPEDGELPKFKDMIGLFTE